MKKISIIIPVYNVEKYLRECLNSVICQTYKNLEIILIDDGSTDDSGNICEEYKKIDNRIIVIHKTNEGLGMARNTGLEVVTGQYVYFLDSDDYIKNDEIEYLYEIITKLGVEVCYEGFISVNDNKNILRTVEYTEEVFYGESAFRMVFPRMLGSLPNGTDHIEMSVSGQLYSMRPIREYRIRFVSERLFISEDLVFNKDYLIRANGACMVKRIGNYYRCNPDSLSHQYRANRFEQVIDFYQFILIILKKYNFNDNDILRHTKTFFINFRSCISQEHLKTSGNSFLKSLKIIKDYCNNITVQEATTFHLIHLWGFKQKLFVFMVKHRLSLLLYMFS